MNCPMSAVEGVCVFTRIRLMAVIMSTLHVGLLISRLPMNYSVRVCVCEREREKSKVLV